MKDNKNQECRERTMTEVVTVRKKAKGVEQIRIMWNTNQLTMVVSQGAASLRPFKWTEAVL